MENIQYSVGNKYIVISRNVIQSRKYMVNKITIGELVRDTGKSFIFVTDNGDKRIRKRTISKMIDVSAVMSLNEQFLIDRIEAALV